VDDIVDGLLRSGALDEAVGYAINLGSGRETKILDLANTINEKVGNKAGIRFSQKRNWDTKSRVLADIARAKSLIGYEPSTDLQKGLGMTIQWFRDNWDLIKASADFSSEDSSKVSE
jgi:nucleoside-diphosphate-sugar epimerase